MLLICLELTSLRWVRYASDARPWNEPPADTKPFPYPHKTIATWTRKRDQSVRNIIAVDKHDGTLVLKLST